MREGVLRAFQSVMGSFPLTEWCYSRCQVPFLSLGSQHFPSRKSSLSLEKNSLSLKTNSLSLKKNSLSQTPPRPNSASAASNPHGSSYSPPRSAPLHSPSPATDPVSRHAQTTHTRWTASRSRAPPPTRSRSPRDAPRSPHQESRSRACSDAHSRQSDSGRSTPTGSTTYSGCGSWRWCRCSSNTAPEHDEHRFGSECAG